LDFTDVQKALAYAKTSGLGDLEVILETINGDFPVPVIPPGFSNTAESVKSVH
jgi:hypothetical protein